MCRGRTAKRMSDGYRNKLENVIGCLPKRSGNMRREPGARRNTGGAILLAEGRRTATAAAVSGTISRRLLSGRLRPMGLACKTPLATFGSGSRIAGMRITKEHRAMDERGKRRTADNAARRAPGRLLGQRTGDPAIIGPDRNDAVFRYFNVGFRLAQDLN